MSDQTNTLPQRNRVQEEYRWRLEDIYSSDEAWEKDFQSVPERVQKIKALQGQLSKKSSILLQALQLQDDLGQLMESLFTYARMRRDEDNSNTTYQALTDRVTALGSEVNSTTSFLLPEILAIPDGTLQNFLQKEEGLELYRFALDDLRRQKPHVLSEKEEALLAQTGEVTGAASKIFTMLNNADLTFPVVKDSQGKEIQITHGRYGQLMESRDRDLRRHTFQALYKTYRGLENTISATLSTAVKRAVVMSRIRKYPSALESALFGDKVPLTVYDNLIKTVRQHLPTFYRYVEYRKKQLQVEELHMYDLYTPIVEGIDWQIPYEEAVTMVQEGLKPLGNDYGRILEEAFQNRWIDVYENRGKTSGAYSWGPYGTHPYVLLNYQDKLSDVFTLAHEMGHALHSYYSYQKQPYVYAHYSIFVAEVASTVNESLLIHYLLKKEKDKTKKRYLLNHYLEQFRGTVYRQTMFAEFEKLIHNKVESGEALTPENLKGSYKQLNQDYYGPNMIIDEEIDVEWARIPHFYNNFYVYKYATGFAAATALTKQILEEGDSAVQRYLEFLAGGSSQYPLDLLKIAGVNMESTEPIKESLQLFEQLLKELESLT
ncbi:oligoendopeptidase F [Heliorestis acidaminivorans]|uniref:Oligopeptidase F n=1 Tax=Heliorestis acidaminivorans TaxID=553427 RepID=A0A6I0F0E1_9FIRM|nr:oligoendopeptidase F [Heliorestis acidaminivorans]KAB2953326.1 oligoendopeptidase F [Heliorestis acidaminivorans]